MTDKDKITFDVNEIIKLMSNPSPADVDFVKKAFAFAEEAHKGQKRLCGHPYFIHSFATAKILAELGLGPMTIAAGFLHDVIEDAGIKPETIKKEFGEEVLFLVEGVTKLGKIKYRGDDRYIESLRKLFVAMSEDIRVLIIKFADRLHNMRTLEFVPKEKQKRIASETLEIYAPLAYRLGIRKLNRELEDLSFKFVYPKEYAETKALLKQKEKEDEAHLEKFHKSLAKGLVKEGVKNFRTERRIKGLYSLYQKLKRKQNNIENIYDISAIRVIVQDIGDCYKTLGAIHKIWRPLPGRIKDYTAVPKPNGYKSIHTTVFTGDGGIIEVQIRTEQMHKDDEYGIASNLVYRSVIGKEKSAAEIGIAWVKQLIPAFILKKDGSADEKRKVNVEDLPKWIKELAETQTETNKDGFMEELKEDFFKNRVFVFTPKGDVIDLPADSSAIDFAFAVHSEIGIHMHGAKVNNKMASFDTKLKNGDIVEIAVKETARPNRKWLDYCKTGMARKHIKAALGE